MYDYSEYDTDIDDFPQRQPEIDKHQLASEVLNILQASHYNKMNAKRAHYATWFRQM